MDIELLAKKMREEALAQESFWKRKVDEMILERKKTEYLEAQKTEQARQNELKLAFNAGRYAGGARDAIAINAWNNLEGIL